MAKFEPMRFFLRRMRRLFIGIFLFFAGLAVYSTYKLIFWPHVQAVVTSIEPICVYSKKNGRRSTTTEYLGCNDGGKAVRLIADGYRLSPDKESFIEAIYEVEPGRKTRATLRPWWDYVDTLHPGSVIQIRYSSASPSEAELVTGAEKVVAVILGFFVGALLLACLIGVLTYEGDEQATSA